MKNIKYIYFILLLGLFNCKSIPENTKNKTDLVSQNKIITNLIWKQVGPSVPNKDLLDKYSDATQKYWHGEGQVSAIWINPKDDNHLLIGVAFGGLFETFDAGKNWKSLTDKVPVHQIQKIKVKNDVIYISTGYRFKNPSRFSTVRKEFYGLGVIKSLDGGKTWHLPKVNFNCDDFSLSDKHNTIYAVSWNKVYKSINNGDSFIEISNFSKTNLTNINDKIMLQNVVVHPTNPDIAYISGRSATSKNGKLLYKTVNGGKTWTNEMTTLENFVKEIPKNSIGFYIKDVALFFNEKSNNLWIHYSVAFEFQNSKNSRKNKKIHSYIIKSLDFKNFNFEMSQLIRGGNHYSPKFYEKEGVLYLLAWYLQIKKLDDTKFVNVGNGKVHQDCRAVGIDSKGIIYYGNDAGIVKSVDQGKTWTNAYYNLNANLINEMGYYSDKTERRLDIGTQDDGYYRNNLDGLPRYPIGTHEGGIYTSPHDKDRLYIKGNSVRISINGGKRFKVLKLNNGKPVKTIHIDGMLIEDPVDSKVLYVGHINDVYVSNNLGEKGSWVKISPKNGDYGRSTDLAIPKSNNKILYLANRLVTFPVKNGSYDTYKSQGHLMKSTNKGKTWTKISSQFNKLLTNAVISDVEVDDENPNRVWFTLRNLTNGQKVFYSKNGGKTWQNISYNLPNVPVNRLEYHQKSKLVILANDYGVYYLENKIWKEYGIGLPKVIITSMVLDYNFNEILVSTFGRGVWRVASPQK
ncbi:MAG: hypothetical protein L3J23_02320 [Flavobacteriaceae bacterium]|nr:hypothetical protein [Flavobacteriaceae bacterium]